MAMDDDSKRNDDGAAPRPVTSDAIAALSAKVSDYAKMQGKSGAASRFRADRYKPDDLGSVRVLLHPEGRAPEERPLHDLSLTGFAFERAEGDIAEPGLSLGRVIITIDGFTAYDGEAAVISLRDVDEMHVIGATFLDDVLNIDEMLRLKDVRKAHESSAAAMSQLMKSWTVPGHHEFKALVAELSLFLRSAKAELQRLEQQLPWEDVHGDDDSPAKQQLIAMLDQDFCTKVVDWFRRIDRRYREIDPACADGLKAYSRALLHDQVLEAPLVARMFQKPLGYAGDYVVMNYLYSRRFEGQTLYAKAVHRATTFLDGGEAVRSRKEYVRDQLRRFVDQNHAIGRPLRFASIAAGPAQETLDFVQNHPIDGPQVEIVLFDQDARALGFAQSSIAQVIKRRRLQNVKITYIQDAIRSLLHGQTALTQHAPFDAIFAAGLFDYLNQKLGTQLVRWFFDHLAPGGICLVGNFATTNPSKWCMEHLYEWYLVLRTPQELAELAAGLGPGAKVDVSMEKTGVNLFLVLRKA